MNTLLCTTLIIFMLSLSMMFACVIRVLWIYGNAEKRREKDRHDRESTLRIFNSTSAASATERGRAKSGVRPKRMKRTIKGIKCDTSTATKIAYKHAGVPGQPDRHVEDLYITPDGQHFVHTDSPNKKQIIKLITANQADNWLINNH